jgi:hypothetical protein
LATARTAGSADLTVLCFQRAERESARGVPFAALSLAVDAAVLVAALPLPTPFWAVLPLAAIFGAALLPSEALFWAASRVAAPSCRLASIARLRMCGDRIIFRDSCLTSAAEDGAPGADGAGCGGAPFTGLAGLGSRSCPEAQRLHRPVVQPFGSRRAQREQAPLGLELPGAAAVGGATCSARFGMDVVSVGCGTAILLVHRLQRPDTSGSGGRRREQRVQEEDAPAATVAEGICGWCWGGAAGGGWAAVAAVAGSSVLIGGCAIPLAESRAVHRLQSLLGPGSGGRRREQRTQASGIVAGGRRRRR